MSKPALRPPLSSSTRSTLLRDHGLIFAVWALQKLVIFALSLTSKYAYDSSTTILFDANSDNGWSHLRWLTERYTRWDTLYFTELSRRGNVWEQEWAFGRGWWGLVGVVAEVTGISPPLTGILLSHLSHLGAVFMLYNLTQSLQFSRHHALLTSLLHALSPAGIFLAAGYTESLFALLSFVGMLLYSKRTWWADFLAAVVWGYSGTVRSTGIFYAGFWAWRGVVEPVLISSSLRKGALGRVVWFAFLGVIVLSGFVWTQWEAYQIYCPGRPWCDSRLPMIYNFVQSHYWAVGFLRYWTLNQVPMWILAGPMLALSTLSTVHYAKYATRNVELVPFVVLQAFLILVAVTTMHVQIWTRVSSSSVPTYWYAADIVLKSLRREVPDDQEGRRTTPRPVVRERHVTDELKPDSKPEVYRRTRSGHVGRRESAGEKRGSGVREGRGVNWGKVIVGFFVGYNWVQALLYSRFLPPA